MSDGGGIRAFLAVDPPEGTRREMVRIQERLKREIQGEIRWVAPAGIHLTLKFFGDIAEGDIERISRAVDKAAIGAKPFQLGIAGLGVFPDARRPRVVWLGTTGETQRLETLQAKLERGLEELGFPGEDRPFQAHWTLGRIKSPRGLAGLTKALEWGAGLPAVSFTAGSLILFRSELTPRGAVYSRLAEYAFEGE